MSPPRIGSIRTSIVPTSRRFPSNLCEITRSTESISRFQYVFNAFSARLQRRGGRSFIVFLNHAVALINLTLPFSGPALTGVTLTFYAKMRRSEQCHRYLSSHTYLLLTRSTWANSKNHGSTNSTLTLWGPASQYTIPKECQVRSYGEWNMTSSLQEEEERRTNTENYHHDARTY